MAAAAASPLNEAIEAQAIRNERNLCLGAMATSVMGIAVSGLLILTAPEGSRLATATAPRLAMLCALSTLWFAGALFVLSRGRGARLLPWLNGTVEPLFPVAMMLIECFS